jgi:predicted negative regulator of RcsB-dependent stress response
VTPYETDDEKVEAIKKWWKDNGISVATGVVIGLAVVFGWRAWGNLSTRRTGAVQGKG